MCAFILCCENLVYISIISMIINNFMNSSKHIYIAFIHITEIVSIKSNKNTHQHTKNFTKLTDNNKSAWWCYDGKKLCDYLIHCILLREPFQSVEI